MRIFRRPEHPPVGLEISGSGVKLLQVVPRADGRLAVLMARRPLPPAPRSSRHSSPAGDLALGFRRAAEAARQLLADGPVFGNRVIAALPGELIHLRTIRISASPGQGSPTDDQIRREANGLFPFDLCDARLQSIYAGLAHHGPELRHEVFAAASPAGQIDRFLAELERVGLQVDCIDLAPCAVYRAIEWNGMDRSALHAIVDVDDDLTRVTIGQGSQIRLIREIPIGADRFRAAISQRLAMAPQEAGQLRRRLIQSIQEPPTDREPVPMAVWRACRATVESLASEVGLCFRYHRVAFRGPQPKRVAVAGPEAADLQLRAAIASATGLHVSPAGPLDGLDLSRVDPTLLLETDAWSQWMLPLGLALRGLQRPVPQAQAA